MFTTKQFNRAFSHNYPGVAPSCLYCQFTGKRIGWLIADEYQELVESLKGMDVESAVDDWAVRLFASMRPSPRWNKMRTDSLDELRKSHPIETTAYLLNRLFDQPDYRGNALAQHHDRIRLFPILQHMSQKVPVQIGELLYSLIDIDAKLGLISQRASFSARDFFDAMELDSDAGWENLANMVTAWYDARIKEHVDLIKVREQTSRWYRDGNTMSKSASTSQFFERKPPSKKAVAETQKKEKAKFMAGLLSEILNESSEAESQPAPSPKPKPSGAFALGFLNRKPETTNG